MNFEYKRYSGFYQKQKDIIDCKSKYTFTLAANKTGKTFSHLIWLIEKAILQVEDREYCWLAPNFKISKIAFDLAQKLLRKAGIFKYCQFNIANQVITFPNKSKIRFLSADEPNSCYGYEFWAIVVDEASRCKEESWNAITTTTIYTKAPIKCIANPINKNNWYYKLWLRAKAGEIKNAKAFKLTAYDAVDAGFLDIRVVEEAKKNKPNAIFIRDFLAEVPESDTCAFNLEAVEECFTDYDLQTSKKDILCYGIDFGNKATSSADYTVIVGITKDCRVGYFDRFKTSHSLKLQRIKSIVGLKSCYVDSTGAGDPILELLQKELPKTEGYIFTNPSKNNLIENLAYHIHNNIIKIHPSLAVLKDELQGYEVQQTKTGKITYNNGKGTLHDDTVIALALAIMKYKELTNRLELNCSLVGGGDDFEEDFNEF